MSFPVMFEEPRARRMIRIVNPVETSFLDAACKYVELENKVTQLIDEIGKGLPGNLINKDGKRIVLGLLKATGLILVKLKAKDVISKNVAKWSCSLLLSAQILYGVCLMVQEINDYLRLGAMRKELKEVLSDTWGYVDGRKQKIDVYMEEIERITKELAFSKDGDVNNDRLVKEFDYNVHMMLLLIHECQRQLQSTEAVLRDTELELENIEILGYGEISMLYGGMAGPVKTLFSVNSTLGASAGTVAVVALVGTLVAKWLKEGKREEIKNEIKATRDGIVKLRRNWTDNVNRVQAHIEFLQAKGFPVNDMPKWFKTTTAQQK